MDAELMNITDELVFEECRQPYILQLTDGLRYFRFFLFTFHSVVLFVGMFLWIKYINLPRLSVRPFAIIFLYFSYFVLENIGNSLTEATNNKVIFLSTCVVQQFIFHTKTLTFLAILLLSLFYYFMRFKLFQTVLSSKSPYLMSKANSSLREEVRLSDITKTLSVLKYSNPYFLKKAAFVAAVLATLWGLIAVSIFCPQISSSNVCPNDGLIFTQGFIFGVLGLFVFVIMVYTSYVTTIFPDPFGIIREVLVITGLYILKFTLLQSLEVVFPFSQGVLYRFTPFTATSIATTLQLLYVFPYQIYLAFNQKQLEALPFHDILTHKGSLEMFKLHIQNENSAENLKLYLAVNTFKTNSFNSSLDKKLAKLIYDAFIDENGKQPVNLPYQMRKDLQEIFDSNGQNKKIEFDATVYDAAQNHVFNLMESDSYVRFINGPLYRLFNGITNSDSRDIMKVTQDEIEVKIDNIFDLL